MGDLDGLAKEAALVGLYRQGRISKVDLRTSLGLARVELDGVLKRHGVTEDLETLEEYEAARERAAGMGSGPTETR